MHLQQFWGLTFFCAQQGTGGPTARTPPRGIFAGAGGADAERARRALDDVFREGNGFDILCTLQNVGRDEHRLDVDGLVWLERMRQERGGIG